MRVRRVLAVGLVAVVAAFTTSSCSISPGDKVGVTMKEWSITLSPTTARSGRVRLAIDSVGSQQHDLALILAKDISEVPKQPDGTLDLSGAYRPIDEIKAFNPGHYIATSPNLNAGEYLVLCTLTSTIDGKVVPHYAQGMIAKLKIVPRKRKTQ